MTTPTPQIVRDFLVAIEVSTLIAPTRRGSQMLALVSHGYLPRDAKQLVSTGSCGVWRCYVRR